MKKRLSVRDFQTAEYGVPVKSKLPKRVYAGLLGHWREFDYGYPSGRQYFQFCFKQKLEVYEWKGEKHMDYDLFNYGSNAMGNILYINRPSPASRPGWDSTIYIRTYWDSIDDDIMYEFERTCDTIEEAEGLLKSYQKVIASTYKKDNFLLYVAEWTAANDVRCDYFRHNFSFVYD